MSAIPRYLDHDRQAEPLDVLRVRAEARAYLFAIGDLDLQSAVDPLADFAHASGLMREIGADAVQAIIGAAFRPYRIEAADETGLHP